MNLLWFRKGSDEDPVKLHSRLSALERILAISRITAGGTGTGIPARVIPPAGTAGQVLSKASTADYDTEWADAAGGGDADIYVTVSMPGNVRTATASPFRVPVAGTLTDVWVNLATASSSGSVTARLNIGANDYDTSVTASNTSASSSPAVALTAGDIITPEITAAGTGAADLSVMFKIAPTTGQATLYVPVSMPGTVRLATATPYRVPVAGTINNIWVNMTTASSSGSVTARLNIGASDYDVTVTATNTSNSSTPAVAVSAGDLVTAEITAAGTGAADLTILFDLEPS